AKPAALDVAGQLVADLVGSGPAARGVGRHFRRATATQEPPYRYAKGLAENVPQRAIDPADRRDGDAAAAKNREDAAVVERVVAPGAAVELLPEPGDVARILTPEQRAEFLVDQRGQCLVLRHAADLRLGLTPAGDAALGLDPHDRAVERQRLAEIA